MVGLPWCKTICKRTTRTSAARIGLRRHEARTGRHGKAPDDTGRHEVAGLITQRSLVQIQPAQRLKPLVRRGVEESALLFVFPDDCVPIEK